MIIAAMDIVHFGITAFNKTLTSRESILSASLEYVAA